MTDDTRAYDPARDAAPLDLDAPWGRYAPTAAQRALIATTRGSVLQRGSLRRWMSGLILSLGRPLDIRFRDAAFRIAGENNLIEYGLLARPGYNAEEIDFLGEAVRGGGTFVDIGCNIGLYSLPLARVAGPAGTVVAIDANAQMMERLNFNAQASDLANVLPVHSAVGAHAARVDLRIRRDDAAIVSVVETDTGGVRMRPLADILADAGLTRVDALKIDIEGHEDAALVPYLDSASPRMRPRRIVIEKIGAQEDYPGCTAAFARHGYRLIGRTRNNSLYQSEG